MEELGRHGLLATADAPQPRSLQYEDLSKLTYLNLVIKVGHGSNLVDKHSVSATRTEDSHGPCIMPQKSWC